MTKEELEKATVQELIEQRNYCGVDGYYGDYLDDVNAEMLKRFNRLEELEKKIKQLQDDIDCLTLACENYREEMEKNLADATELEKENAELKEYLGEKENTVHTLDVLHKEAVRKYGEVNDQLTTAKEIIKKFLLWENAWHKKTESKYELLKEAEQFLNEVSE